MIDEQSGRWHVGIQLFSPAQEFRATLVGRVTDTSGASIAGARIGVTNMETNTTSSTLTTDTGDYVVPALLPGRYRLEVDQPGFRKHVREGITLNIRDRTSVDVQLELGELNSSVTVTADVSLIETSSASRGAMVTGRTITDMPLNAASELQRAADSGAHGFRFPRKGGLLFPGVNGLPRSLTEVGRNNFAPRIGFAYNVAAKTVLRGGTSPQPL